MGAYLSTERVQRAELQLIGCCCIWIASKYHEIYAPEANDFAYIADHSFEVAQLFKYEIQIITKLKFRFADIITPLHFAERFMQIALFPLQKKYKDRGTAKALRDGQPTPIWCAISRAISLSYRSSIAKSFRRANRALSRPPR